MKTDLETLLLVAGMALAHYAMSEVFGGLTATALIMGLGWMVERALKAAHAAGKRAQTEDSARELRAREIAQ